MGNSNSPCFFCQKRLPIFHNCDSYSCDARVCLFCMKEHIMEYGKIVRKCPKCNSGNMKHYSGY